MIKTLKLTKFRKHEDRTFEFGEGLVVCRGANESGKTTIQEGMLYALYGAKVLRDSLSQCVTWGHKESELKVELVLEVEGQEFSYRRSKAGAEVIKDGNVFVTGQSEVTAFSATLLGADAKTAGSLMLADQSGLRGALDEGPTAVSGLMSKLADFDTIDRIILAMQETLLLGADAPIRDKLKQAEADLTEAFEALPPPPKIAKVQEEVGLAQKALDKWQKQRVDNEAPTYNAAVEALAHAEAAARLHADAVADVGKAQERLGKVITDLDDAKAKVVPVDFDRIAALRREVFDGGEGERWRAAHNLFMSVTQDSGEIWEGDMESLEEEIVRLRESLSDNSESTSRLNSAISTLRGQKIYEGVCKVCGTDVSERLDISMKNAGIDAEIEHKLTLVEALKEQGVADKASLKTLEALVKLDQARRNVFMQMLQYIRLELSIVPVKAVWTSKPPPMQSQNLEYVKSELAALEKAAESSKKAEGEVEALEKASVAARGEYEDVCSVLQNTPAVDLTPYNTAFKTASDALTKVDEKVWHADSWLKQATASLATLEQLSATCLVRVNTAKERIDEYTKDIEAVGFNNTLLKKMRAIKPSVTDYLWNSVLAAVSQFFTQLRGEASVVTKDSDGFKVNGASVKSLSGSTLDVLALAVRVALTKTFIPNSTMLVLDEPGAGCDQVRMASLLGFLSSVGFKQVLLASHDSLSLNVADRVINIGE